MGPDDRSDIEELVGKLQSSNNDLVANLEPHFDIEAFINFWVMEILMMHADGYARNTNNFYIYSDPESGQFHFIPWGIDSILFTNAALPWEEGKPPESVWAEGVLARRLYNLPSTQAQFFERMEEVLVSIWDEEEISAEIDRMVTLLEPFVLPDENEFANSVTKVRNFVSERRAELRAELDAQAPLLDQTLRDPWCLAEVGTIDTSFSGVWVDNVDAVNPFDEGSSSITSTIPGYELNNQAGGAVFGIDPNNGDSVLRLATWLQVANDPQTESSEALVIGMKLNPNELAPQTLMFELPDTEVMVLKIVFPPAGAAAELELIGMVGQGTLTLSQAGGSAGAPWMGSLEGTLYELPF
jgi:hypothetical protein